MAKVIMIQGTMSNAGKSLLVAGLCRLFSQDGYRVRPFKSQNMALNSFATHEGLEIGRAQAMQAEACGVEPSVYMNPVLLKPTGDSTSQVIVNGKSVGNMTAKEYFAYKRSLLPGINEALRKLSGECDIIVIEGAGSPAEINLRDEDIVNMGLAELIDAPVLLVGDIDRGGVFAQLYGTYMLLSEKEKDLLKGVIINKFRGDKTLLQPGIDMMKDKMDVPFVGTVPYCKLDLDDEDSLSGRFEKKEAGLVDIAAIRFPRISNFTDLDVFGQYEDVSIRYVDDPKNLGNPHMIVLPGSKNTLGDLKWLKSSSLGDAIKEKSKEGIPVFGICGGFQMLGERVLDPLGVEEGGEEEGLGLLPLVTTLEGEKATRQFEGSFTMDEGIFGALKGENVKGYEIHMGVTTMEGSKEALLFANRDNIYGTYIHGIFDETGISTGILKLLAEKKGISLNLSEVKSRREFKEREFDKLAKLLRENLDMDRIYSFLKEVNLEWEN